MLADILNKKEEEEEVCIKHSVIYNIQFYLF